MNEAAWSGNESLPLSLAQRVDAVCYRFEEAWKTAAVDGPPPRVEEFLAYAIALDVKEARGDHLTGTFFNTITQR